MEHDQGHRTQDPDERSLGLGRRDFIKRSAVVGGLVWASPVIHSFTAPAFAGTPVPGEGCTPGFWRDETPANIPAWDAVTAATGHTPTTLFVTVFGVDAFPGKTLHDVLGLGGGGLNALGRHAVAAWLNAVSGLDFPFTATQVIDLFKDTWQGTAAQIEALKDQFAAANESGDCPWGADGLGTESLEEEEEELLLQGEGEEPGGEEPGGEEPGGEEPGGEEPGGEEPGGEEPGGEEPGGEGGLDEED
jgi:hypothetical protein